MCSMDDKEAVEGAAASSAAAALPLVALGVPASTALLPACLCACAAAVTAVPAAWWPFMPAAVPPLAGWGGGAAAAAAAGEAEAEAEAWPLPAALLSNSADGLCAAWPLPAPVPAADFIENTIDGRLVEGGDSRPPLAAAAASAPPAGNAIATAA